MFVIGMSILLEPWGAAGIALASSIAWLGEALVLLLLLRQEMAGLDLKEIGLFTLKVFAASVFAVLGAAVIYQATGLFISTVGPHSIFEMLKLILRLAIAAVAGVTAYFYAARFMRIDGILPVERLLNRVLRRGR
jgi:peptidoglycan biosynthesis protein MviN/MurJ (putative lipid II flippase)